MIDHKDCCCHSSFAAGVKPNRRLVLCFAARDRSRCYDRVWSKCSWLGHGTTDARLADVDLSVSAGFLVKLSDIVKNVWVQRPTARRSLAASVLATGEIFVARDPISSWASAYFFSTGQSNSNEEHVLLDEGQHQERGLPGCWSGGPLPRIRANTPVPFVP